MTGKKVGYYLERTTRKLKLAFHHGFKAAGIDLTPEQWVMLDLLSQTDGQTQSDLGNASFKDAPTISRIIDVLVKRGWVDRTQSPDDRRIAIVNLTPKGLEIFKKSQSIAHELRTQSWNGLDDDDYEEFIRIVNIIFKNFSKE